MFSKKKPSEPAAEWTKTGSFVHKPSRGWLHADDSLREGGVCYAVRYVGCLKVLKSMRTLPYEMRQQVTREAILNVCECSGYHIGKKKKSKNVTKILGDVPNMSFTGTNVNLTISAAGIKMLTIDGGKIIVKHDMQGISFASGGEKDCIDMVGYIAKDDANGRACHVIDCGGGLAFDVINTIGQAFEIRYKMFLENPPKAMEVPEKFSSAIFDEAEEAKYNEIDDSDLMDPEYAEPRREGPEPRAGEGAYASLRSSRREDATYNKLKQKLSNYDVPRANQPQARGAVTGYDTPRLSSVAGVETSPAYDNALISKNGSVSSQASSLMFAPGSAYDNPDGNITRTAFYQNPIASSTKQPKAPVRQDSLEQNLMEFDTYDNPDASAGGRKTSWPIFDDVPPPTPPMATNPGYKDYLVPVDSQKKPPPKPKPYAQSREEKKKNVDDAPTKDTLHQRGWFHGNIPRVEAELLLKNEGDFLVRESKTQTGQFVLSGIQKGVLRHLLLVDPQGQVRTKDKIFSSVEELVDYHMNNGLPIISAGSEVTIKNPITKG